MCSRQVLGYNLSIQRYRAKIVVEVSNPFARSNLANDGWERQSKEINDLEIAMCAMCAVSDSAFREVT
jgi:hypothetical protein